MVSTRLAAELERNEEAEGRVINLHGADDEPSDHDDEPLPPAIGRIARLCASIPPHDQRSACDDLLTFVQRQDKDLYHLNGDNTLTVAMVHVPKTMTVRIVYGLGVGTPGFREQTVIDRKPLCLIGDVDNNRNVADGMRLLPPFLAPKDIFVPPRAWIDDGLKDESKAWPLVRGSAYDRERPTFLRPVVRVCPIPAYFVLDGFENDLNIRVVTRRLEASTSATAAWAKHALDFLQVCTLQPKAQTVGTSLPPELFLERPSPALKAWCATRTYQLCPELAPYSGQARAPTPAPTPPAAPTMTELFQQFIDMQKTMNEASRQTHAEEKKAEEPATTFGLAPSELKRLLVSCVDFVTVRKTICPGCIRISQRPTSQRRVKI